MPQAQHLSRRRHASLACNACRENKTKCNGGTPVCSNCSRKKRECIYRTTDKRKLPLRGAVELLSGRVAQLTRYVSEHGLQAPLMVPEESDALKRILGSLGLHDAVRDLLGEDYGNPEASEHAAGAITNLTRNDPTEARASPWEPGSDSVTGFLLESPHQAATYYDEGVGNDLNSWSNYVGSSGMVADTFGLQIPIPQCLETSPPGGDLTSNANVVANDHSRVRLEGTGTSNEEQTWDEVTSNEDLVDELSRRVSTLALGPAGRTKLYGPSSILNIEDVKVSGPSNEHRESCSNAVSLTQREGPSNVPEYIAEHLTNLYFEWENPVSDIVDREIYTLAKAKHEKGEDTSYFSPALCDAICALGAAFETRYHPTFVTFPKSLVGFFVERARTSLEAELDSPSLATNQAMMVLSFQEAGNGNKTRAWLYSGMAVRLAFDLALHLDMSSNVSAGEVSAAEADMRSNLFWGIHSADHVLGFELGRPVRVSMEDVTVQKPSSPGLKPAQNAASRHSGESTTEHSLATQHVRHLRVALFDIMAACGYFLYGSTKYSKDSLQKLNVGVVMQLCDWKENLPPGVQVNLDGPWQQSASSILLLHMHYHQSMIYAHRPWMSKHALQPQPPRGPGYQHAREMCVQSAIAISKLLALYEHHYDLRRIHHNAVHIASSAALLLGFADMCLFPERENESIKACLSTCFRALEELSASWKNATQVVDALVRIQRKWRDRRATAGPVFAANGFDNAPTTDSLQSVSHVDFGLPDESGWMGPHDSALFDFDFDWPYLAEDQV